MELKGKIVAGRISNNKFSISGKLATVNCKVGDSVDKGKLLAFLDKTELQAYLDRSLKEYDLERALFDEKQKLNLTEYEKRKFQDSLDISIKNVEIAKANLDAADLYSSIQGIITEMDLANPDENITPSGFTVTVVDPKTLLFMAEIPEEDISKVNVGQEVKITLKAYPDQVIEGKVESIGFAVIRDNQFPITISISNLPILRPGLSGTAMF